MNYLTWFTTQGTEKAIASGEVPFGHLTKILMFVISAMETTQGWSQAPALRWLPYLNMAWLMLPDSLDTRVQCVPMFLREKNATSKLKNPVPKPKELGDGLIYHQYLYKCHNTFLLLFIKITTLQNSYQKNPKTQQAPETPTSFSNQSDRTTRKSNPVPHRTGQNTCIA